MKQENDIKPPRWADRFLNWYCRADLLEDLQGDLNEYFNRNIKTKGVLRAKLIYIIDVFKFFRIYTVRKPEFIQLLIHWIMLASYIKTSGRNIIRNKLFSAINIIGLAISMCVGMLIIGMLKDVYSYDQFHKDHDRIYRITSQYQFRGDKSSDFMATTSLKAGTLIEETFAQPEAVSILKNDFGGDLMWNNKTIPLSGFWTNPDFFKVFSFNLVKGDAKTALKEPYSIILTEKSAKKLFGDEDPYGKSVILNNEKEYTITGILKDIPLFSTIKFEMLGSLSTYPLISQDEKDFKWDEIWFTHVFLMLPENYDLNNLQANLDALSATEDKTVENVNIALKPQALDDIMSGETHSNEIGQVIGKFTIIIFVALATIVIISACFNYTNLSIARSLKRTKEVGIRKVIGAAKTNLIFQFVTEAVIISLFSFLVALALFLLIRPLFLGLEHSLQELLRLELTPVLILYFIGFAIITGVIAGIFPAIFFARVNISRILKDFAASTGNSKLTFRRALIVFQYTISVMFICGTIAMYRQYKYFINFDLGFTTKNILHIPLQGNKSDLLTKDFTELPEVKSISLSVLNPGVGHYWSGTMKYKGIPDDSASVYYNIVDENYIPQHDHKLIAGRNFVSKAVDSVENEVIVNAKTLKRFNIHAEDPAKAIDEILIVDGKDLRIVGVVQDFQYGKAVDKVNGLEVIFRYSRSKAKLMNVALQSDDMIETYAKLEQIWKKHDPVHPFEARFYSEQIEETFSGFKSAIKVAGILATLAIAIASLGLLGMVVFTTQTRLKEVSIRKVLGANEGTLLFLLGKGFIIMLGISTLIGFPLTILFFEKVAFPNFANHATLSLWEMSLGVLSILVIALIMIFAQAMKVTRVNPADVLKAE